MSRPCFILNIFLHVHSINRSFYRFLLTRLDYCICNWSADYDSFTFSASRYTSAFKLRYYGNHEIAMLRVYLII